MSADADAEVYRHRHFNCRGAAERKSISRCFPSLVCRLWILRSKGRCLCFTILATHCFIEGGTLCLTPPGDISICPFVHSELFSFYQCYRLKPCQINSDVPLDQPGQLCKSIGSTHLFHWVNSLVPLGQLICSIGSTQFFHWVNSDVPMGQLSCSIGSTKLFHWVNSLVPLGQLSCFIN